MWWRRKVMKSGNNLQISENKALIVKARKEKTFIIRKKENLYNKKEENGLQPYVGNCKPFLFIVFAPKRKDY